MVAEPKLPRSSHLDGGSDARTAAMVPRAGSVQREAADGGTESADREVDAGVGGPPHRSPARGTVRSAAGVSKAEAAARGEDPEAERASDRGAVARVVLQNHRLRGRHRPAVRGHDGGGGGTGTQRGLGTHQGPGR